MSILRIKQSSVYPFMCSLIFYLIPLSTTQYSLQKQKPQEKFPCDLCEFKLLKWLSISMMLLFKSLSFYLIYRSMAHCIVMLLAFHMFSQKICRRLCHLYLNIRSVCSICHNKDYRAYGVTFRNYRYNHSCVIAVVTFRYG